MVTVLGTQLHKEFDMSVISDGAGDMPARLEQVGIPMQRMPLTTKWSFAANIPKLSAAVRSHRPDLVHLHGQFAGSLGQLALQVAGRPRSVYSVQWPSYLDDGGRWSRLRNHAAERVSCAGAAAVVAVSEHDRRELVARKLCNPDRLSVIYNAYFITGTAQGDATPKHDPVVGFVGRLVDQKGVEFLVRAAPLVLAVLPTTRFVIVGDGPERERLERLAEELHVAAAVEFAGYDPEPAKRMRSMTVLAVPSVYEPLGMVALEAMAIGVPVVGSAVGGIPEAVEAERTGLLVPPGDPAELAKALLRILESPALAAEMGAAGRERARRVFSPEVIAAQYATLYRRLLVATTSS